MSADRDIDEKGEAVRLQKWLADAGLCSRREGERWIQEGRVAVNGVVVTTMGTKVTASDTIQVDGNSVNAERETAMVVLLHKPRGVVCTRHDPEGRRTVYDLLSPWLPRLNSVGRLDYNSEGLLLFTNDGELANRLTHPSRQVPRSYKVKAHGPIAPGLEATLQKEGVTLDDGPTGPLEIVLNHTGNLISWFTITLREGRNRMVRRIFEACNLDVARLIRFNYGGVTLSEDLPAGAWRPLNRDEVTLLRRAAGFNPRGAGRMLTAVEEETPPPPAPPARGSRPRRK